MLWTYMDMILIILSVAFLLFAGLFDPFFPAALADGEEHGPDPPTAQSEPAGNHEKCGRDYDQCQPDDDNRDRQVEELSLTMQKIQGTLGLLVGVEEIVRRNVHLSFATKVRTSMAVAKGVRVFLDHLLSKRRRRRIADDRFRSRNATFTGAANESR